MSTLRCAVLLALAAGLAHASLSLDCSKDSVAFSDSATTNTITGLSGCYTVGDAGIVVLTHLAQQNLIVVLSVEDDAGDYYTKCVQCTSSYKTNASQNGGIEIWTTPSLASGATTITVTTISGTGAQTWGGHFRAIAHANNLAFVPPNSSNTDYNASGTKTGVTLTLTGGSNYGVLQVADTGVGNSITAISQSYTNLYHDCTNDCLAIADKFNLSTFGTVPSWTLTSSAMAVSGLAFYETTSSPSGPTVVAESFGTSNTITLTKTTTAGNTLVVNSLCQTTPTSGVSANVSGSISAVSGAAVAYSTNTPSTLTMFTLGSITGGDTSISLTCSVVTDGTWVYELSGVPNLGNAGNKSNASGSAPGPSITTTAPCVIIEGFTAANGTEGVAYPNNFGDSVVAPSSLNSSAEYNVAVSGTYNASWFQATAGANGTNGAAFCASSGTPYTAVTIDTVQSNDVASKQVGKFTSDVAKGNDKASEVAAHVRSTVDSSVESDTASELAAHQAKPSDISPVNESAVEVAAHSRSASEVQAAFDFASYIHVTSTTATWAASTKGQVSASTGMSAAALTATAGDSLLVCVTWFPPTGTATLSSVTSTGVSDSFTIRPASLVTIAGTGSIANLYSECATATSIGAGSTTVSATFSASVSGFITVTETTPGVYDQASGATGTSATPSAGALTPSANGSFVLADNLLEDGFGFGSGWFTAGTPFTLDQQYGGGITDGATEYVDQGTAAAVTGAFGTNYSSVSGPWVASIIDLKPSSTPHTATTTDTEIASDTATEQASHFAAPSDVLSNEDSAAEQAAHLRASSDVLSNSDSATYSHGHSVAPSDVEAQSDSAIRQLGATRLASDTQAASDSVSRLLAAFRASSDVLSQTESATRQLTTGRVASEVSLPSDSASRLLSASRAGTDSAIGFDSAAEQAAHSRASSDMAQAFDTASAVKNGGVTHYTATPNDIDISNDLASRQLAASRSASDVAQASDTASRLLTASRSAIDGAVANDQASESTGRHGNAVETAQVMDSASRLLSSARSATDVGTSMDVASIQAGRIRSGIDASLTMDLPARQLAASRSSADIAHGMDNATASVGRSRTSADLLNGADIATTVKNGGSHNVSPNDVVMASDIASRQVAALRNSAESGIPMDSVSRTLTSLRSSTEGLSGADIASAQIVHPRSSAEAGSPSDLASRLLTSGRTGMEIAQANDLATRNFSGARSTSEIVPSIDVATAIKNGGGAHYTVSGTDSILLSDLAFSLVIRARGTMEYSGAIDRATTHSAHFVNVAEAGYSAEMASAIKPSGQSVIKPPIIM